MAALTPAAASITAQPAVSTISIVGAAQDLHGGYWEVSSEGQVLPGRGAPNIRPVALASSDAVVAVAGAANGAGFWVLTRDGVVTPRDGARYLGSVPRARMLAPAVGIASSDDGGGYWVITARGQVFNFGDAKFEGSLVNQHLADPVVGLAPDPISDGYWLLTQRGQVYNFGLQTPDLGSLPVAFRDQPAVGLVATASGFGYWIVQAGSRVVGEGDGADTEIPSPAGFQVAAVVPYQPDSFLMLSSAGASVLEQGPLPPTFPESEALADPEIDLNPWPDIYDLCYPGSVSSDQAGQVCLEAEVAALDRVRASEDLGPVHLPLNWVRLTAAEQLLVISDIERTSRGLPPISGLSARLNQAALVGARNLTDPALPAQETWAAQWVSVWGEAPGPLGVDYGWMYDDGWAGSAASTLNQDCTGPSSQGCWGHRQNLLTNFGGSPGPQGTLEMGAASLPWKFGWESMGELLVSATKPLPMYYTWAQAKAAGAGQ
jgi:hypothetical protein